jgi:hypothetical protein
LGFDVMMLSTSSCTVRCHGGPSERVCCRLCRSGRRGKRKATPPDDKAAEHALQRKIYLFMMFLLNSRKIAWDYGAMPLSTPPYKVVRCHGGPSERVCCRLWRCGRRVKPSSSDGSEGETPENEAVENTLQLKTYPFMIFPLDPRKIAWDYVVILLVAWNVVDLPFSTAFSYADCEVCHLVSSERIRASHCLLRWS